MEAVLMKNNFKKVINIYKKYLSKTKDKYISTEIIKIQNMIQIC